MVVHAASERFGTARQNPNVSYLRSAQVDADDVSLLEVWVMAVTLEDLDRRVTALEKAAEREKTVERAVAEIVADSEKRVEARVSASERRVVDLLNERFDKVMEALDRLQSPPK